MLSSPSILSLSRFYFVPYPLFTLLLDRQPRRSPRLTLHVGPFHTAGPHSSASLPSST
jgi:hypothetical protein